MQPSVNNASEKTATDYIPYSHHFDAHTCGTVDGDLTRTIRLAGVPFETMENAQINALSREWFSSINNFGAKNAQVALWTHLVRRKLHYDMSGVEYDNYFSAELNQQYSKRLERKDFFTNELYISPVYRTSPGIAERQAKRFSKNKELEQLVLSSGLEELDKISKQLMTSLRRYHPTMLGSHEDSNGQVTSELAHFYSRLLNGESGPIAVNNHSVRYAIQRNELSFGHEVVEIASPARSRYVGILGIKAPYGTETVRANLLHGLLRLPCEFVLSQSLTFLPINKADKFLQIQESHYSSTGDNRLIQGELQTAREELQAGKFGMAEHEFILVIYGDSIKEVNAGIVEAQAALEAKNLGVIRERRGTLITQYFSTLPANFKMKRIRAMPIGTNNFTSFFPMHNFMIGNAQGSQWGMPIAMLETTSGSPYFVNYHVSRQTLLEQGLTLEYEREEESDVQDVGAAKAEKQQRKELGNYRVIGPPGSGKTVVQAFLRAMTRKTSVKGIRPYKSFAFDKDYGQEIFITALGGRYFRFEPGEYTGLNPFSLPDTAASHQFIVSLAQWCARQDETYIPTVEDEEHLQRAVADVYSLPTGRRWSRLRDTLPKGKGSLHSVLARWVDDGMYAWVLDSATDRLDLESANDFGFDMTKFLQVDMARTPILLYIMHKIDNATAGSPFSIDIDEAATALKDSFLQAVIENKARTIRKLDGIIGLGVQNPSDITEGLLSATLTQQFPTTFIFPNPSADRKDYVEGLKLTEREFELVQQGMLDEPGKFLLKKGMESVVVRADLTGMNNILAVLSGSADNVAIAREIWSKVGTEPKVWLSEFFKRRV